MSTPAEEAAALAPPAQERKVIYLEKDFVLDGYAQLGEPFTVHTSVLTRDAKQKHSEVEPAESLAQARQKARQRKEAEYADALMIGPGELTSFSLGFGGVMNQPGSGYLRTDRVFPVVAYKRRGEEEVSFEEALSDPPGMRD